MPLRGIVLLAFTLASLPVCFVRPFYGILVWTIIAFLNPHRFTWSAADAFPWALAVGVATLAGFFLFTRGWLARLANREIFLLLGLWTWFTITSIMSIHTNLFAHHAQETWARYIFVSKILLMTVVMVGIVDSFQRLRVLLLVIAGCFGFFVIKSVPFIAMTGGAYRIHGPEYSMISDNNDFGLALNMTLPIFFYLSQTEHAKWVRNLFGLVFLAAIPTVLFTYSRGALLGLLAVMSLMFLRLQIKQRVLILIVTVFGIVIGLMFAPESWRERMDPSRPDAVDASARSRFNAWTFAWRLALDYPVAGGGFDTYTPELFVRYAPTASDVHFAHSNYFGMLAEHGFPGLLVYLCLVSSTFASLVRLAHTAERRKDLRIACYANAFRFALVGYLVSGLFLGRQYFDYFFTIVGCTAILKQVSMLEWANEDEEEESRDDLQVKEEFA